MKLTAKDWLKLYIIGIILIVVLAYTRPHSFYEIMPDLDPAAVSSCEAVYAEQGVNESGGPIYTTVTKSFEAGSEDYTQLMELLTSVNYRKQLAVALSDGRRNGGYSISYPHSEIIFEQDGRTYRYCLWNRYLPAGPIGEMWDYTPTGGRAFYSEVTEFIRTHGETIDEEVREY